MNESMTISLIIQDKDGERIEYGRRLKLSNSVMKNNDAINMMLGVWGKMLQSDRMKDDILKSVNQKLNL